MIDLSKEDKEQIGKKGYKTEDIEWQLENFKKGFPPIDLVKPATIGDGIIQLDEKEIEVLHQTYSRYLPDYHLFKFVPASGAASRMFSFLFEYLDNPEEENDKVNHFIKNINNFAFYDDLKEVLESDGYNLKNEIEKGNYSLIIQYLLHQNGLNYGNRPKALIKFHQYGDHSRTSFEEHLVEASGYATNVGNKAYLHFTISPDHRSMFSAHVDDVKDRYEKAHHLEYVIDYSYQKESTDMIAVDPENNFFRNPDGSLLFRPGGHGALLENLNAIDSDLVFIKNIDNVIPDRLKDTTNQYKKVLAGLLIQTQQKVFEFLRGLEQKEKVTDNYLRQIQKFMEEKFSVKLPEDISNSDATQRYEYLFKVLNRPIRVCGMVKNQGEPGGGPFIIKEKDGSTSLQIVEMAQIDTADPKQKEIVSHSSHFNPVDLVCGVKNYKGKKFDLNNFKDPSTGIISEKTKDGKKLKAQELPGLWNGGMAFWNTMFVEVPLITFNPVKTVNDLLRKEHQ